MNTSASYSHEVAKSFLSSDQTETFQGKYWILFKRDQKLYLVFKFVYLTDDRSVTSFLRGAPPPKKIPGSAPEHHLMKWAMLLV